MIPFPQARCEICRKAAATVFMVVKEPHVTTNPGSRTGVSQKYCSRIQVSKLVNNTID